MSPTILPEWRFEYGPGSMPMPHDPPPTLADFRRAANAHAHCQHEDSQDVLNPDGTWGPPDPGVQGGTGVAMGYACDDFDAVDVAVTAVRKRAQWHDGEHWIRQIRYPIAAWEMTHESRFADQIVDYGDYACAAFPVDGPITDDPADVKQNLAQYLHYAEKNPHTGLGYQFNGRKVGWIAYGRLMQMKVARTSPLWITEFLRLLELAAIPGTGQIITDSKLGVDQTNVQYGFHAGILLHAALCAYKMLGRRPKPWVYNWMNAMEDMPPMDNYGVPSPPSFTYTSPRGRLMPATGPEQKGDPGCAYWSHNCALLYTITNDSFYLERSSIFGSEKWADEQSRRDSMLIRGVREAEARKAKP